MLNLRKASNALWRDHEQKWIHFLRNNKEVYSFKRANKIFKFL